jgi:hypothetical protein
LHAGFAKAKVMSLLLWMLICKNSPEEIPGLYDMIVNGKIRFGFGLEKKRYDSVVAKICLLNYLIGRHGKHLV